jgi:hypothetical protein
MTTDKQIIEKLKPLNEFVFWLNSMTTTELIKEFPTRFHLLDARDSVTESVNKYLANDAILWNLVKEHAKKLSALESQEGEEQKRKNDPNLCCVCHVNYVDSGNGYDTCDQCNNNV